MKFRLAKLATAPAAVAMLLALAYGCARPKPSAKAPLTEHQRDSVLATEPIPGAPAVGAALRASEKASEQAAGMDSLTH